MQTKAFLQDTIEILTRELNVALQTNTAVADRNDTILAENNYLHDQIKLMNEEAEALEVENRLLNLRLGNWKEDTQARQEEACASPNVTNVTYIAPLAAEENEEDAYLIPQCFGVAVGTVMRILEETAAEVTLDTGEDFLGMQTILAQAEELREALDNSIYWDGYPSGLLVQNLYDLIYPS